MDRPSSVAPITAGQRESGPDRAAEAKMLDPAQSRAGKDRTAHGVADPLGPRNQAFGSEPDADGLFRHLEKLGERRGEPFCVGRRDGRRA